MSNYTQIVEFGPKDLLLPGDPDKAILGAQWDAELDAIATAISSKEDSANKAIANGYASLDAAGKLPSSQLTTHAHSGSDITSGTVGVARLGSGTPSVTTFLRGDGTWSSLPGGSATWGALTGTLSDQLDLQAALDAKAASSHTHDDSEVTRTRSAQGSNFNAVSKTSYWLTANSITVTLPASPSNGDWVDLANAASISGCTVARNGKTIMGLSADMSIDTENFSFVLEYYATTGDWRIT